MGSSVGVARGGSRVLVGLGFALEAVKIVYFPVTGFVLIGSHMVLVLWEAAGAFPVKETNGSTSKCVPS